MAALLDLRMPGVYTQEIQTLPPTVGVIPSAVPVFIGYTEKAEKNGVSILKKPTRIQSMREYEDLFGGPATEVKLHVDINDRAINPRRPQVNVTSVESFNYKTYYALLLYYANGGGPCFIISVGDYNTPVSKDGLLSGIEPAVKAKEITILVFPEGTSINQSAYKDVVERALMHCAKMKNRVTIIDVSDENQDMSSIVENFQTGMPNDIEIKKYGMAYYPPLETGLSYSYLPANVTIVNHEPFVAFKSDQVGTLNGKTAGEKSQAYEALVNKKKPLKEAIAGLNKTNEFLIALKTAFAAAPAADNAALKVIVTSLETEHDEKVSTALATALNDPAGTPRDVLNTDAVAQQTKLDAQKTLQTTNDAAITAMQATGFDADNHQPIKIYSGTLQDLRDTNGTFYERVREGIKNFPVKMPASPAIAGIYVRNDATQGVWVAPANVSVFGAIRPTIDINDDFHANLNAPPNGKSINAIRTYSGRGLLVFGARTLAGNDLEWRYVSVRRTFCFIEDSIAIAMQDFVFAPNTPQTWIKVRSMIKSFLNRLWKAGGLFGNTPEEAYEVLCDTPTTFSTEEMLSGIMRVFIKVAVARPAEFIVLQYEHKFQLAES
jgi:uncharacterized protein